MRWPLVLLILASLIIPVAAIQISEIMYDPVNESEEWLELYNNESMDVNLSGWTVLDPTRHTLSLVNGSWMMPSYTFVIIAESAGTFANSYNYSGTLIDASSFGFNEEDWIALNDSAGNIIENVTYTNIADEGNTLQLLNGTFCEGSPTPGANNSCLQQATGIKLDVCLDGDCALTLGILNLNYDKLFKVTNLDHVSGQTDNISVSVDYNISINGSLVKESNFTIFVNSYTTVNTGSWTPNATGNYTICGTITASSVNDSNSADDSDCATIEVIDSSSIACDLSLEVNATDVIYGYRDTIDYDLNVIDLSCSNLTHPYLIQYEIEDFFGDFLRNPYNSTYDIKCEDSSSHQKAADEICGTEAYYIKAKILQPYCNDTNSANNEDKFLIIVKGKNPESSDCKASTSSGSGGSAKTTTAAASTTGNFDITILNHPQVVATGQTFLTTVEVRNKFSTTKTFEVYSYIFDKNKPLTKEGWNGNKQEIQVFAGQVTDVFLVNTVRTDIEPGNYQFRARVALGDDKVDDTKNIEIIKGNTTNETESGEITSFYSRAKLLYPGRQISLYSRVENKLNSEQNFTLELVGESTKDIGLGPKAAETFEFPVTLPETNATYDLKLLQNGTLVDERSLDLVIEGEAPIENKTKTTTSEYNYTGVTGAAVFSSKDQNLNVAMALFIAVLLILTLALLKSKSH